ncbi:hypothetical protein [Nitrosopumilus sp.]|uniref:hypothetical protein n=1 Tax=Nitrosopumilus sp. TaxID=2024843 RepID=UPI00247C2C18|nr:hypothetical protein [Nitrosopumilus sp.]MCV0409650.1 hypothetical protein [Nitrosopumilus sp.]
MKTRVLLFLALVSALITPLLAEGLVIPSSTEELLEGDNLIVLGTISDVKVFDGKPTEFHIDIEQVIQPQSFDSKTVVALGCDPNRRQLGTPCTSYEQGQRGLFLIFQSDDLYRLSFESRVSDAMCSAQEFLSTYRGFKPHFFWTQDGQYDVFFTGKPVDIHFVVTNSDMTEQDYSVGLTAHTNGFAFSDVVNGTIPQCVGFETVTVSFVPTKMGTYGFNSKHEGGGDGSFGTAIIDHGSSPKQQIDAQIYAQDVWCKENLFLILKNDDTKPRYDNHPACATKDTVAKLIQRDWGFVPSQSKYNEFLEGN